MLTTHRFAALCISALALSGCTALKSGADRGGDSGSVDAASSDARFDLDMGDAALDAGPLTDLGTRDFGGFDSGASDLGSFDLGLSDLGPADLGSSDLGLSDLGPRDLGPLDLGPIDLGPPPCGDGRSTGLETCDDGFTQAGDGCSAACRTEPGFVCTGDPSVCRYTAFYAGAPVRTVDAATVTLSLSVVPTCRIASVETSHAWSVDHTYAEDLLISLVGPTGTSAILSANEGGARDVRGPYVFAVSGALWPPVVPTNPIPSDVYAGPLGVFTGTRANGLWVLSIADASAMDSGTVSAFSIAITCIPDPAAAPTVVAFPTNAATVNTPSGGTGVSSLGVTGSGRFTLGDYVQEAFTRTTPTSAVDLDVGISDATSGCAVGAVLSWNVLINRVVVGSFSFATRASTTHRVVRSYTFPSVTPGVVTVRLEATSTVCTSGGTWGWVAGGVATLR